MSVDPSAVEAFAGRVLEEQGVAISALLAHLGDRLGFYRALAGAGPLTAAEVAAKTDTQERMVAEWLANQAAGGYLDYEPASGRFSLPAERAAVLADETSPAFMGGAFQSIAAIFTSAERLAEVFRSGEGMGWHEHHPGLFEGTERFFRPGYRSHLTESWIPSLEGVEARLRAGGRVADVGCGHGASTLVMARAYPEAEFHGFDYHPESIEIATERARAEGLGDRVRFDVASAKDFPGSGYDLIAFFDCLHDMGDPVGAASHARGALATDGAVLLVEPFAEDQLEDNCNPLGRIFYGFSTVCCTPASLAQEVGTALGAQAGEARLRGVMEDAGFTRFRRASQTPANLILEARH